MRTVFPPVFLGLLVSALFLAAPFPIERAYAASSALCTEAGIASLSFGGIPAVKLEGDVCRMPEADLPPRVRALIREIGAAHRVAARTLGQSFAETFSGGVPIAFMATGDGSLASSTVPGSGILMSVFADWDLATWPKVSYTHELTHHLIFSNPAFAPAVRGLEHHPFIVEALPDLVALVANRAPIMPIEDAGLPPGLRIARDATPTRSLDDAFARYTLFAPDATIARACAKLPKERNAHTRAVCAFGDPERAAAFFAAMPAFRSDLAAPTAKDLAAEFDPAKCLYTMRGWDVLGACNTHQFALPLTSFFFALEKALGRPQVARWIAILKAQSPTAARFECAYRAGAGAVPAELVLRGVSPSLRALRDGLAPAEAAKFDRVWDAHGFAKLAELDALFVGRNLKSEALMPLLRKNPRFGHHCSSPFVFDPVACDLECRAMTD